MVWVTLVIIILLILFAGMCAAIETSITAASPGRINSLIQKDIKIAEEVQKILKIKNKVISTFLVLNSIVLTVATTIATGLCINIYGDDIGTLVASVALSIGIIIFADVLPKTIAVANAEKFSIYSIKFVKFCLAFLRPVNYTLDQITKFVCFIFRINLKNQTLPIEEIRGIIDHYHREGNFTKEDVEMLFGIIDIKDTAVSEIMVHKNQIISIDVNMSPAKALNKAIASNHLSIPVWQDNKENIIGILNVKKLLVELVNEKINLSRLDLKDYIYSPYFIPENMTVFDQLIDFKNSKSNLAIIIDEYGDLQGLITFNDIIEEIIGEVRDDTKKRINFITKKSSTEYIIDASSLVRDVNRKLGTNFKTDNANTIAGLIISKLERIPKISEEIIISKVKFTVLKISNNTVKLIKAEIQR